MPVAEAMWLTIPSPRTKCVSTEIESNVVVLANYYIIDDKHTHLRTATISSRNSARLTIPEGPSIACNTAKAIEWDAVRLNNVDPSGRAALGVHLSPYDKRVVAGNIGMVHSEVGGDVRSMMEVSAAGLCFSMDGSTAPASFCKLY